MIFGVFAILCFILALVATYFGVRVLGRFRWIMDWLRGMFGMLLVVLAIMFILIAMDFVTYKEVYNDKPILSVSIAKKAEQHFEITLLNIDDSTEKTYEVYGDQWQVDARVIRWTGVVSMFGARPGYRLDRLSGRYYSLEDEHRKPRSAHALSSDSIGLDMWAWVHENGVFMPLFDAVYGSAAYLPMQDGALFEVSLGLSGLAARPLNSTAEEAVNRWR